MENSIPNKDSFYLDFLIQLCGSYKISGKRQCRLLSAVLSLPLFRSAPNRQPCFTGTYTVAWLLKYCVERRGLMFPNSRWDLFAFSFSSLSRSGIKQLPSTVRCSPLAPEPPLPCLLSSFCSRAVHLRAGEGRCSLPDGWALEIISSWLTWDLSQANQQGGKKSWLFPTPFLRQAVND